MKRFTAPINYTPIPKENVFIREDGRQDENRPNRFYFNFSTDWCTVDKGETIIRFRKTWMSARRRQLEFNIKVRKYFRNDTSKMSQVESNIVSWLPVEKDLREVWKYTNKQLNINGRLDIQSFSSMDDWISKVFHQWTTGYPKFFINDEEISETYIKNQRRIRDVQMDGFYDCKKVMTMHVVRLH